MSLCFVKQGFLPGPDENEKEFLKRMHRCCQSACSFPIGFLHQARLASFSEMLAPYEKKIVFPSWTPILFSSERLRLWQGGATWIDDVAQTAFVQLHARFRSGKKLLGIYSLPEILAHELVHALRMAFPDSAYEEFLAYRASCFFYRRVAACFFLSPYSFTALFFFASLLPYQFLFNELCRSIIACISFVFFCLSMIKCLLFWSKYQKLQSLLAALFPGKEEKILLFFTKKEVAFFSRFTAPALKKWLENQTDFRWRMLYAYMINS